MVYLIIGLMSSVGCLVSLAKLLDDLRLLPSMGETANSGGKAVEKRRIVLTAMVVVILAVLAYFSLSYALPILFFL